MLALAGLGGGARATSGPNPASFTPRVDNPWFPLRPGTVYVYQGVKDAQPSADVLVVTPRVKKIEGVPCVVVEVGSS